MSVLTKVFIVLLSFLSVALSMFVVAAFSQQENWKASAEDWQRAALSAQAKERAAVGAAAVQAQMALEQHQADSARINTLNDQISEKDNRIAELEQQLRDAQSRLAAEQTQVTHAGESSKLLLAAFNSEKEFSAKLARRNSELERINVDLTDRVKELTVNVEMARAQVRALQQQIAAAHGAPTAAGPRGLAHAAQVPGGPGIVEAGVPSVEPETAPPSYVPIRGEITNIDADGKVASISIGSADGVAHGMTFLIYRRAGKGGKPQYLGTLRITRVEANEAAGTIEHSEGDIKVGDLARDEASFAMRG